MLGRREWRGIRPLEMPCTFRLPPPRCLIMPLSPRRDHCHSGSRLDGQEGGEVQHEALGPGLGLGRAQAQAQA